MAAHRMLTISIPPPIDDSSYRVDDGRYIAGVFAIDQSGLTSASPQVTTPPMDRGVRLEDIEKMRVVGRGNSGTVHKARHVPTGKLMAVKIMTILEREHRHQILKELKTLHEANSPFLVHFYGAFYDEPAISMVLEYMDMGSLLGVLRAAKKIPEPIVAIIARQIMEGLAYLHGKRQIHRDIKPSNIVLNSAGEVKLTDFGISTELANSIAYSFVGTFNYMSPERVFGKGYSYKSDIWSAGILLLECALGKFPYPTTDLCIDVMANITAGPPTIPSDISPELQSFLHECLQSDENKRSTASDLMKHPFISQLDDPRKYQSQLAAWLKETMPSATSCSTPDQKEPQ